MSRPMLLDLFCGQGGASKGYHDAGFDVVGVDIHPQPRYPYTFHRGDALLYLQRYLASGDDHFAAFHASCPCQLHSRTWQLQGRNHPELIGPTRALLNKTQRPYVIENVEGAPLRRPVCLCGGMFGLRTYRHRLFETNWPVVTPKHPVHRAPLAKMGRPVKAGQFMHVVGNFSDVSLARSDEVMGMPWANRDGLREAIPPAYSEYIGRQLLRRIGQELAA